MADQPPVKDMTALLDHMKVLESQGLLPKAPGGEAAVKEKKIEQIQTFDSLEEYAQKNPAPVVASSAGNDPAMQEKKIDPIQHFESLEEYAQKNPPAEPEASPPSTEEPSLLDPGLTDDPLAGLESPPSEAEPALAGLIENEAPLLTGEPEPEQASSFTLPVDEPASTTSEGLGELPPENSGTPPEPLVENPAPEFSLGEPAEPIAAAPEELPSSGISTDSAERESTPVQAAHAPPTEDAAIQTLAVQVRTPLPPPELPASRVSPRGSSAPIEAPSRLPSQGALESIRQNIRTSTEGIAAVPVDLMLPFTVRIDGPLKPDERARLLQLLEAEKFPIDLKGTEMQMEAGRVLIPRISEFAAIALVRALRASVATVRLAPSDEPENSEGVSLPATQWLPSEQQHAADTLPLVTYDLREQDWETRWPHSRLDSLLVSLVLVSAAVEVEETHEYKEALERLKAELRHRAHFKRAHALGNLKETLSPLPLRPLHYRLSLAATVILPANESTFR